MKLLNHTYNTQVRPFREHYLSDNPCSCCCAASSMPMISTLVSRKGSPSLLEKPGDHQGSPGFGLADFREQFFRTIEEEVGFAILVLLEDCPGGDPRIIHSLGSGDVKIVGRVIFGNG